ncbi:MAG: carbon-nitrogen hydrolase family protein [Acholeplasmataceae bacterium]
MKIALASQLSDKNINNNFKRIKNTMMELKNQVDLISFGEAFLHGFDALSWDYQRDKEIAISIESHYIKEIQTAAKDHKTSVSFGFFELFENSIFCSYIVIDNHGEIIGHYKRVSPGWKEITKCDHHYKEGRNFSTFSYMGKEILIVVCGDLWYDENIDNINKMDKDFILWPVHLDYKLEQWDNEINDYLFQTSKLKKPVLMINNISKTSHGGCYYFENGKVIKELSMGKEGFLIIDL